MAKRVRIKMCGMTRSEDIQVAASMGVDAIGLIFYAKSPRGISLAKARRLLDDCPAFMSAVAVLVNPDKQFVDELIASLSVQYLQFHGSETPAFCEQFSIPYIKAIPATSKIDIIKQAKLYQNASALLLDTPAQSTYGGSGKTFDWQLIPKEIEKPLVLAGGLTPDNVTSALRQHSFYAVDVCSGVELQPGVKNIDKMNKFVSAVHNQQGHNGQEHV